MTVVLLAAAAIAAPGILLRRRAIQRYFAVVISGSLAFALLALAARPLRVQADWYLVGVVFGVLLGATFWLFVALSDAHDVRWSAGRAAIAVGLFYIAAIPLMLRAPIDGDEPFYLLITESLVRDHDLDLANQYRDLAHSATGRTDLTPQLGDPIGPHGERYSRHEPFLPLLLVPGYIAARLPGALITIALFGALLARSTVRLFEDEGIADATTRAIFPLIALGPPILFYSVRIWPEVPAAFFFVEALRGIRQRRAIRWLPALFALVLLKLRFLLIAVVLLGRALRTRAQIVLAIALVVVPLLIVWLISGNIMNVHTWRELTPSDPLSYWRGLFGLALDGTAGILLQAPIYLFAVLALLHWRDMPAGFRVGMSSAVLYILTLVPRPEWHGGWSPPLRYIVVLMPVLALGCAVMWERMSGGAIAVASTWTVVLVAHGLAYPWRLFHIENGENFIGETLSSIWHSDFSRLFPSFIRPNFAAWVASGVLILAMLLWRVIPSRADGEGSSSYLRRGSLASLGMTAILALAFLIGRRPGDRIEFEDAHVIHQGGELYPEEYTVGRFAHRGGWILREGESVSFLARAGVSVLEYSSEHWVTIQIGNRTYALAPTGSKYGSAKVEISEDGRTELRCLSGAVNLDRMDHE
jgi:hypothetical protein